MLVNILTKGLVTPNSHAFLYPLLKYNEELLQEGIATNIFRSIDDSIFDCDVLIVEHNYFSNDWNINKNKVLGVLSELKNKSKKLFYFDISDSAGLDHFEFMPYVNYVFKNQVYKNKKHYMKPFYGYRLYTDYYHNKFNVSDENEAFTSPLVEKKYLDKIKIGWNSSFSDYSYLGLYRLFLYKIIPAKFLLKLPIISDKNNRIKSRDISCRFNMNYVRETVAYQRKRINKLLENYTDNSKVSRKKFFEEIKNSKIVVSPFGFGELCYRDYEAFLYGGLLLKPDMSHIETWPPLYDKNKTYISFDWSLSNLEEKLESILSDYNNFIAIAKNGQNNYQSYVAGSNSSSMFVNHFKEIINY
jgi:hypothetical protein